MKPQVVQTTIFKCRFCGNPRPSGRSDREYCNDSCKMKAYRWRCRLPEYGSRAWLQIDNVAEYLKYPEMMQPAVQDLLTIRKHIDDLLKQNGITKIRINGS